MTRASIQTAAVKSASFVKEWAGLIVAALLFLGFRFQTPADVSAQQTVTLQSISVKLDALAFNVDSLRRELRSQGDLLRWTVGVTCSKLPAAERRYAQPCQ